MAIVPLGSSLLAIFFSFIIFFSNHLSPLLSERLTESSSSQEVSHRKAKKHVRIKVLHYILPHWGISRTGDFSCDKHVKCDWIVGEQLVNLRNHMQHSLESHHNIPLVSVALYNIHTLWEKYRNLKPQICQLSTNISMYETEESVARFSWYFDNANVNFDGYSSTHPNAQVQRVYAEAFLNASDFLPRRNFSSLIKAGAYIASDCHRRDGANSNRDGVVTNIRNLGFRVDGLGRCLRTNSIPEGINLQKFFRNTQYNLHLKREVLNYYAFYLAFENSIEPGYVTEKPFDALLAGSVPIYLGDAQHLKSLLPHPKAAIFVADYENLTMLTDYLKYLLTNETAYEEHHAWRKDFSYENNLKGKPLMLRSWQCRVCEWAAKQFWLQQEHGVGDHGGNVTYKISNAICPEDPSVPVVKSLLPKEKEGTLYRHRSQKSVYLVKNGVLHLIPDFNTFIALGFDISNIKVVDSYEFDRMMIGEDLPRSSN